MPISPLQFWESVIPKTDRSTLPLIVNLISSPVIQELKQLAEDGTLLGYLQEMVMENHCIWPSAAMERGLPGSY